MAFDTIAYVGPAKSTVTLPNDGVLVQARIRVLKVFDLPMLLIAAEASEKSTVAYLAQLVRAGFLERLDQPGEPHRRYRIVLDTGPHHPSIGRATVNGQPHTRLLDHNSGAELHMPIEARRKPVAPFFDQER